MTTRFPGLDHGGLTFDNMYQLGFVVRKLSLAGLFTPDGAFVFRTPDGAVSDARGIEGLAATFASIQKLPGHNLPTVRNHVIAVDGDRQGEVSSPSGHCEDSSRRECGRREFALRDPTPVGWERVG